MQQLQHDCRNATTGIKARIRAYRKAPNEIVAEKEWQAILGALQRIEGALDAYHEEGKRE